MLPDKEIADAQEIMRFVSYLDGSTAFAYAGSKPNRPLHQAPKSVALVNSSLPCKLWNRSLSFDIPLCDETLERSCPLSQPLGSCMRQSCTSVSMRGWAD